MKYITRPLTPEARARLKQVGGETSPFSAPWSSTLNVLDRELWYLGVRSEFVLQIDCTEADLRLDGQMRANARAASPAVAIAVDSKSKGSLLFVCGRFPHCQDNVRAIALGLEALRKVERFGIVQSDEQYRGWQALPPGTPLPAAKMTVERATEILHVAAQREGWVVLSTADAVNELYREAALIHHPDRGGDPAAFREASDARDLLLEHLS